MNKVVLFKNGEERNDSAIKTTITTISEQSSKI